MAPKPEPGGRSFARASECDTHPDLGDEVFDAVVIGGGPGGCAAAIALAQRGASVVLLEKDAYPREKVCGDGLTPRAVRMLDRLRVPTDGWPRTAGLKVYASSVDGLQLDWPTLRELPNVGMVARREEFDDVLAGVAIADGVRVVTDAAARTLHFDPNHTKVVGVETADGRLVRTNSVVLADGNASRLSRQLPGDFDRNPRRPMGVAVRAYYRTTRPPIDHIESWLELWDGKPGESELMPGYGWLFDLGDGTVNIGLGQLNSSRSFGRTDYREQLRRWVATLPPEWGISEETRISPIKGAALPMAHNRALAWSNVLLVGDAAGMVSPFNGEGISYAMEAGEFAAEAIAEARRRGFDTPHGRDALAGYPKAVRKAWGGYFRLGTIFVRLIGNPRVMHLATRYGLPRRRLMIFVNKMLAHLFDTRGGAIDDRILNLASTLAPSA